MPSHRKPSRQVDNLAESAKMRWQCLVERRYAAALEEAGIAPERIRELGFAFSGKAVLIG